MIGHTGPCDAARGGEALCVGCRAREPLTADTITDEQIIALRASLDFDEDHHDVIVCDVALEILRSARLGRRRWTRTKARARCAEILNAQPGATEAK